MSLPTGVAKRGSNYHLQIKVPARLQPIIKRPFWIRTSLGCADKPTAAALAHRHWAEATAAFAAAEAKLKPKESVSLSPALATYILKEAERLPLVVDEVLRFEPGALVAWLRSIEPPPLRFLTTDSDGPIAEPEYLRPSSDGSLTHAQAERLRYLTQLSIDDFGKQMSLGRLKVAQDFAEESCSLLGLHVDWTASSHRPFLIDVLRTMLMGWIAASERGQGKPVPTPPRPESPLAASVVPKSKRLKTLSDVFDEWKVGKKRDAVSKMTRALSCLESSGIKPQLAGLTRQDGLAFRDHINATMHKASGKTRSDVLANIQALLNFARKEKGWLDVNPWAGTAIAKGRAKKRDTWSESELRVLLAAPPAQDRRLDAAAQYWIPLC